MFKWTVYLADMTVTYDPTTLQQARTRAGLTVRQAATEVGITHTNLIALEKGRSQPLAGTVARLSTAYGVPVTFFFPRKGSDDGDGGK